MDVPRRVVTWPLGLSFMKTICLPGHILLGLKCHPSGIFTARGELSGLVVGDGMPIGVPWALAVSVCRREISCNSEEEELTSWSFLVLLSHEEEIDERRVGGG